MGGKIFQVLAPTLPDTHPLEEGSFPRAGLLSENAFDYVRSHGGIIGAHRMRMRPIATDGVEWSLYTSVCVLCVCYSRP